MWENNCHCHYFSPILKMLFLSPPASGIWLLFCDSEQTDRAATDRSCGAFTRNLFYFGFTGASKNVFVTFYFSIINTKLWFQSDCKKCCSDICDWFIIISTSPFHHVEYRHLLHVHCSFCCAILSQKPISFLMYYSVIFITDCRGCIPHTRTLILWQPDSIVRSCACLKQGVTDIHILPGQNKNRNE